MAMFRFIPGGGGTRGKGRGGRRPMLRVLESAMASTLLPSLASPSLQFSHLSVSQLLRARPSRLGC